MVFGDWVLIVYILQLLVIGVLIIYMLQLLRHKQGKNCLYFVFFFYKTIIFLITIGLGGIRKLYNQCSI